jgi:hypothetical protein
MSQHEQDNPQTPIERYRQLGEMSASLIREMTALARTKRVESRSFSPEEAARFEWLNDESNRLLLEKEATERGMRHEWRTAPQKARKSAAAQVQEGIEARRKVLENRKKIAAMHNAIIAEM